MFRADDVIDFASGLVSFYRCGKKVLDTVRRINGYLGLVFKYFKKSDRKKSSQNSFDLVPFRIGDIESSYNRQQ